jgi:hypothetical protein
MNCFCSDAQVGRVSRLKAGRWLLIAVAMAAPSVASAQTVSYTTQTGNFNALLTEKNNSRPYAGTYNHSATELANYANNGSFGNTPGAAAFQTFTTTGNGNNNLDKRLWFGNVSGVAGVLYHLAPKVQVKLNNCFAMKIEFAPFWLLFAMKMKTCAF